jgi:hypothetical protein
MLRSRRALTRHGGSLSDFWCYNPGALEKARLHKAEHPVCGSVGARIFIFFALDFKLALKPEV